MQLIKRQSILNKDFSESPLQKNNFDNGTTSSSIKMYNLNRLPSAWDNAGVLRAEKAFCSSTGPPPIPQPAHVGRQLSPRPRARTFRIIRRS